MNQDAALLQLLRFVPRDIQNVQYANFIGLKRAIGADIMSMDDVPYGPIDDGFVQGTLGRIRDSRAELVFVCLGVPRQYYWMGLAGPDLGMHQRGGHGPERVGPEQEVAEEHHEQVSGLSTPTLQPGAVPIQCRK